MITTMYLSFLSVFSFVFFICFIFYVYACFFTYIYFIKVNKTSVSIVKGCGWYQKNRSLSPYPFLVPPLLGYLAH